MFYPILMAFLMALACPAHPHKKSTCHSTTVTTQGDEDPGDGGDSGGGGGDEGHVPPSDGDPNNGG